MNLSNDLVVITCLHPNRVYQFGPGESYHFINIPLIVVNLFLLVFTVLGNTTVILAYFRNTTLQSAPNMLLITLAYTDLFVGIVAQPLFISILVRDVLGAEPLCWLALLSSVTLKFCGGASFMTLSLIISLERYMAICYPLKHRCWITKTRLKRAVGALWSFLLALSGFLLLGLSYKAYFLILSISTFTGVAVTAFSCCGILIKLKIGWQKHTSPVNFEAQIRGHSQCHSAASLTSNDAKKNDYKVAVTMFCIIGAIVVCYTPMFAAIVYAQVRSRDELYLKYFYPNAMTLIFLNSLLNPVIYCLRNRRFTNALRKINRVTCNNNDMSIRATAATIEH